MKLAVLASIAAVLSAYAIPADVVVTAAMDGVTFLSSVKSITSHTLMAPTKKACLIHFWFNTG